MARLLSRLGYYLRMPESTAAGDLVHSGDS
jgi:hypothetical protein